MQATRELLLRSGDGAGGSEGAIQTRMYDQQSYMRVYTHETCDTWGGNIRRRTGHLRRELPPRTRDGADGAEGATQTRIYENQQPYKNETCGIWGGGTRMWIGRGLDGEGADGSEGGLRSSACRARRPGLREFDCQFPSEFEHQNRGKQF